MLEITFLPVGNADCFILCSDESTVVIDLGNPRQLDKWLQGKNRHHINQIYITHAHRDHFPELVKLVNFLKIWLNRGSIKNFFIPHSVYKYASEKLLQNQDNNNPKYARLKHALNCLDDWDREGKICMLPASKNSNPYSQGNLTIDILHPRLPFIESYLAKNKKKLNEISLILRVSYQEFKAIFLADIENEGLKELNEICKPEEMTSHIVKIPHHGAYPKNGDDLKQLLEKIDPELAILSVGSKNQFGHVQPELFKLLQQLKSDLSKRLSNFICTEVTRTCAKSPTEIKSMGKSGLTKQQLCAGEITIIVEISGQWKLKTQTEHNTIIKQLSYSACDQ